ncbi:E3 ubiquitin-protein ligase itt1 [Candida viswanathii]|uniref:RBR-type E3 ubiquitin transferase n=1 Tax=Candida viswanathii TaxID=5486 RepID=A0A367YFC9_9ASCO|nr:E3 ubiquitin-protein ligase itt1 [Candida viswanathii]
MVSDSQDYETEDMEFSDDIKVQELQSCKLIYPDSKIDFKSLSGAVSIPVNLDQGVPVRLNLRNGSEITLMSSRTVNNLPPFELTFQLNEYYPYDSPPEIEVSCIWLEPLKLSEITAHLKSIWEEYKDQVLFNLIDYLQDQSQNHLRELLPEAFDIFDIEKYYHVVDFDLECKVQQFNSQTYTCEICQTDLKGSHCTKFDVCGHVFCNNCLVEYFQSCIVSGDIEKVHCPDFECTKKYLDSKKEFMNLESWMNNNRKARDIVNHLLTPTVPLKMLSKLLQDQELVKRYYTLFKKGQYELIGRLLPNRMVTCPRVGCDEVIFREDLDEKLVVCPSCKYAFCNDCRKSYHARFKICKKVSEDAKYLGIPIEDLENYPLLPSDSHEKKILNAKYGRNVIIRALDEYRMDQLFQQLIREGTEVRECPGCRAVIEKTEGCNKMKCSECMTSFCFHCGSRTANNYDHFTDPESPCYKLLFFGMPGVDDDDL